MADLTQINSWSLSLPSYWYSLLYGIKNRSFLVEDNHETINELCEKLLNRRKKLQNVVRKENDIILELTGKNSDQKLQNRTYITC